MVAISHLFGSHNALLNFRRAQQDETRAIDRLTTGERINRANEAPGDLAISNNLRSEIMSLRQARRVHFEAVSAIQIADDTLEQASTLLTRAAELAVQAASTAVAADNSPAKVALDAEFQEIKEQLDQLNDTVKFNETSLFGSGATITVNTATAPVDALEQATIRTSSFSTAVLGIAALTIADEAGADQAAVIAQTAIETLSRQRGRLGAVQERLTRNMDYLAVEIERLTENESLIRDIDVAAEATALTKAQIATQSGLAAVAQANLSAESVFQLLG